MVLFSFCRMAALEEALFFSACSVLHGRILCHTIFRSDCATTLYVSGDGGTAIPAGRDDRSVLQGAVA